MGRSPFFLRLFLFFLVQGVLGAFTFSPISQEFSVEGKNSSHVFTINNDSLTDRIAVKVSIFLREMDDRGQETLLPCPGDFLIYPSQSILNPGESRSVRVKWQGGLLQGSEKAYRIIAEQLPVDFQADEPRADGGGIRFTFRYEGSLYVVPARAEPAVELLSVETVYEGEEPRLKLTFLNSGTRHVLLGDLNLWLSSPYDNFETIELKPKDLKGVVGENMLAGGLRSFYIPEPPVVQGEELLWEFTFKPVY